VRIEDSGLHHGMSLLDPLGSPNFYPPWMVNPERKVRLAPKERVAVLRASAGEARHFVCSSFLARSAWGSRRMRS
jgi:hypothetical protein